MWYRDEWRWWAMWALSLACIAAPLAWFLQHSYFSW